MRIIDYPCHMSSDPTMPWRDLERAVSDTKRIAAERAHEQRNAEDLTFLAWVKEASMSELSAQGRYAVGWQKVAIDRELTRRARSV